MNLQRLGTIAAGAVVGMALGLGAYTFLYAKGASYMTNDPEACKNCHVMNEQFDGWVNSSHRNVAVCNDCHAPHGIVPKYWTKARNGFNHSLKFTTGRFPEPIRITSFNKEVTEEACRSCHGEMVQMMDGSHGQEESPSCLRCHRSVGHMH